MIVTGSTLGKRPTRDAEPSPLYLFIGQGRHQPEEYHSTPDVEQRSQNQADDAAMAV